MLSTSNIRLSPIETQGDWKYFAEMASSREAYLCAVHEQPSALAKGPQPNSNREGTWGIYLDSSLIGYSQYVVNAQAVGSFSLFIDKPHRRNGCARATILSINNLMFNELQVTAIRHTVFLSNATMLKIFEETGATQVGIIRQGGRQIDLETNETRIKPCVIFEFNSLDFARSQKSLTPSSTASYGIDKDEFLQKELVRLELQQSISMGPDNVIRELLDAHPGATIMDIGAGVGTLAYLLATRFPEHQFIALEQNPKFVAAARKKYSPTPNLCFEEADIFFADDLIQRTDIFIMRLVAQHLGGPSLQKLLKKVKDLQMNRPFKVVICDVDDRLWVFEPDLPGIKLAFEAANAGQKKFGGDRMIGAKIYTIAQSCNLKVQSLHTTTFDSHTLGNERFEAIIAPLLQDKLDPDYLQESAIQDIKDSFERWTSEEGRFGMGTLFTYILSNFEQDIL